MSTGPRYFKQVRFQQLRSFCEAVREQGFAGAAARLGISRPAVWQQVRALEREFGADFLVRRGGRLELTREGRLLSELAGPLVAGFDSIRQAFDERRAEEPRRMTVATTSGLLAGLLREPIRDFRRRHPSVQLGFLDRVSSEAVRLVAEGKADLGVVGHLEEEPEHPLLAYEIVASVPFHAVFPPGHALDRKPRIGLRDLLAHPLVLMAKGSRARTRVDRVLREAGVEGGLRLSMDTTNALMILEFVKLGLGVGIASFVASAAPRWRLAARDVSRLFGRERVAVVRRKDGERGRTTEDFLSALRARL
jgi:DNA-binding transcriptional LysR family regulator